MVTATSLWAVRQRQAVNTHTIQTSRTASLLTHIGARVRIEHKGPGGRIVVAYNTLEELDGILGHIES